MGSRPLRKSNCGFALGLTVMLISCASPERDEAAKDDKLGVFSSAPSEWRLALHVHESLKMQEDPNIELSHKLSNGTTLSVVLSVTADTGASIKNNEIKPHFNTSYRIISPSSIDNLLRWRNEVQKDRKSMRGENSTISIRGGSFCFVRRTDLEFSYFNYEFKTSERSEFIDLMKELSPEKVQKLNDLVRKMVPECKI